MANDEAKEGGRDSEAPRDSLNVDREIDQFADDAFDALLMEDKTQVKNIDVAEIIEKMKSQSPPAMGGPDEVSAEADHLEERYSSRPPQSDPAGAGVSSRAFLDLREALNNKEKEILGLRDELSSRDKQIVDLKDQNIGYARKQADFDDKLLEIERHMAEANETIAVLQQDKDAASKREEDWKSRFERSEEKANRVEEELRVERDSREQEQQSLKAQHEEMLQEASQAHARELERLQQEMEAEVERSRGQAQEALAQAEAEKESAVEAARASLQQELEAARAEHESTLTSLRSAHSQELESYTEEANRLQQEALAELRSGLETLMLQRIGETETEWEGRLERVKAEQQENFEEQLAAVQLKLSAALEKAEALRENNESLLDEVATAQAQLSETEVTLTSVRESLEDTEQARDALRLELGESKEAGQALEAKLSEGNARIDSLEQQGQASREQIAALQGVQAELQTRLENALRKVAVDDALLTRVRKAMAIGLSLLEEQQQNVIADAASPEVEEASEESSEDAAVDVDIDGDEESEDGYGEDDDAAQDELMA